MSKPHRSIHLCLSVTILLAGHIGCDTRNRDKPNGKSRVLVLGMDGLDPVVLSRLMAEGQLPSFRRLAEVGEFKPLATSMPRPTFERNFRRDVSILLFIASSPLRSV